MIYINPDNGKHNLKCFIRCLTSLFLRILWGKSYDFDKELVKFNTKKHSPNDKFVGVLYDCDPMEKELFIDPPEVDFEGHKVYIPHDYDKVLNLTHKNYMELPPEKDRIPHHNYKIYIN